MIRCAEPAGESIRCHITAQTLRDRKPTRGRSPCSSINRLKQRHCGTKRLPSGIFGENRRRDSMAKTGHGGHGNHNVALVQTLIRFPGSQGVFVSHDATLWQNSAPAMTRIREFVAVDRLNRERIERELVRVAGSVHVIHNAVDLQSFNARGPLPDHPRKALILAKNWPHIKAIQAACARFGLDCELLGKAVGQEVSDLPQRLHHYDVVFATARMAIEAMKEYKGSPALDAGLLSAAQAVEHYEISRYGTLRTWAEEIGLDRAAELLQQTLDEEEATDRALTALAETVVNQEAQARAA